MNGPVEAVLDLEHAIFAAVVRQDVPALAAILAEDFVYRNPAGADLGKAAFLSLVGSLPVTVVAIHGERLRADVYGDVAVLTGTQVAVTLGPEGRQDTSRVAFTDVFVTRDDRWLLVLAHAVDLAPSVP